MCGHQEYNGLCTSFSFLCRNIHRIFLYILGSIDDFYSLIYVNNIILIFLFPYLVSKLMYILEGYSPINQEDYIKHKSSAVIFLMVSEPNGLDPGKLR